MNKIIACILVLTYFLIEGGAQIKVSKPAGLDGLIYGRTAQRKHPDAKIEGYHILIFNGDNRSRAESIKAKFDAEYKYYSEVVWDEPNFKVYVGLFKTKFECMSLFNEIKGKYQTAIVVKDKISYPPLNE
jgi:hypothetical protein